MQRKAKILLYDIETSTSGGRFWGGRKYDTNILEITEERQLLSFAYRWHGESTIFCETREGERTDKNLVKSLRQLLLEADITVAHNGDKFDRAVAKSRMFFHNLPPVKINCSVDTLKAAKNYFSFTGNSLDDLLRFLALPRKMKTRGLSLWLDCEANKFKGDSKSWKELATYNKSDVEGLTAVYDRMRPWIENHPNISRILNPYENALGLCPENSQHRTRKKGFRTTAKIAYQQWTCNDCHRWFLTRLVKEAA
jgi:DNA polymerase elongation subunit (family B)